MASKTTRPNGHTWVFVKASNGKRRAPRLGTLAADEAEEAARRLTKLEKQFALGLAPDAVTEAWIDSLSPANRKRVIATGLVATDERSIERRAKARTLDKLIAEWKTTLDVEPQTLCNYDMVAELLKRYFAPDRDVASIVPADADKFRAWMAKSGKKNGKAMSRATVSRSCRTARRIFEFARRLRWAVDNPFEHVRSVGEFNPERCWYVTRRLVDKLIVTCPDVELKAMIALSRYATFRGSSEFGPLTWRDVDFEAATVRITSPKTKRYPNGARRTTPLEGEALRMLGILFELAEDGATDVFPRLGQHDSSALSQRLQSICRTVASHTGRRPGRTSVLAARQTGRPRAGRSSRPPNGWATAPRWRCVTTTELPKTESPTYRPPQPKRSNLLRPPLDPKRKPKHH